MTQKMIMYLIVLTGAAGAGFLVSMQAAKAPQQEVATPVDRQESLQADATANAKVAASENVVLPNLAGGQSTLTDWDGAPRLVNFWATWCAPCRREIPVLKDLQARQPIEDLQVLGIAFDEMDAVREYAAEAEFNYPILVGEQAALAVAGSFGLDLMALPFTLVLNSDGELLNAHIGEIDAEEAAIILEVLDAHENGDIDLEEAKARLAAG